MPANDPEAARFAAETAEAKRLVDERRDADLVKQGEERGQAKAHTADQDRQIRETIETLNTFMAASLKWQEGMVEHGRTIAAAADERMTAIEQKLDKFLTSVDTLAKAAGERGVRNMNIWQKLGVLAAMLGLILLVVSTLHGLQVPTK